MTPTSTITILLSEAHILTLNDGSTRPCGFWAEEFITAHRIFTAANTRTIIATPGGGAAHVEPDSMHAPHSPDPDGYRTYLSGLSENLRAPAALETVDPSTVDGIFVPGGYGPVVDLHKNSHVGEFLRALRREGTPIATVCHGTAALLADTASGATWPYAALTMTSFSDQEEADVGLLGTLPFTVEQEIRRRGGTYTAGHPWQQHIEITDTLITGQNPASTEAVAEQLTQPIANYSSSTTRSGTR